MGEQGWLMQLYDLWLSNPRLGIEIGWSIPSTFSEVLGGGCCQFVCISISRTPFPYHPFCNLLKNKLSFSSSVFARWDSQLHEHRRMGEGKVPCSVLFCLDYLHGGVLLELFVNIDVGRKKKKKKNCNLCCFKFISKISVTGRRRPP